MQIPFKISRCFPVFPQGPLDRKLVQQRDVQAWHMRSEFLDRRNNLVHLATTGFVDIANADHLDTRSCGSGENLLVCIVPTMPVTPQIGVVSFPRLFSGGSPFPQIRAFYHRLWGENKTPVVPKH